MIEAVALYREQFRPSPTLAEPYTIVTAGVLAADDAEQAEHLAGPARLAILGHPHRPRARRCSPPTRPPSTPTSRSPGRCRRTASSATAPTWPSELQALAERTQAPRDDDLDDDPRPARAHPHARAGRRALAVTDRVDLDGELRLALELADVADAITLPPFLARDVAVDWKANHTEVTALDRAAEAAIVARLRRDRPHHRLLGEELGSRGRRRLAVAVDHRPDRRHLRATCGASRCGRR